MKTLQFLESEVPLPLMKLPVRSVFVPTSKGHILISPGSKLNDDDYKKISDVTDIVAPNFFHTGGLPKASRLFPSAKLWGPKGALITRPQISWTHELDLESWPFQDELKMIPIEGAPKINEVVFLHQESRSLIVADLCFNLIDAKGLGPKLILSLFGTYKKFGVSKLWLKLVKDRELFEKSLSELFRHNFDNIIVSHGYNIIGGGKEKLITAFQARGYLHG